MIKKISIIAFILLLIGVVGGALTFDSMNKSNQISEEKIINNDRFTDINIATDNAKIEMIATEDPTTKVELSGTVIKNKKYTFAADVDGNKLSIKLKENRLNFFNFGFFSTSLSLKVYVPKKSYDSMQIKSNNGRVHVESLQAKDINVETDNGRIELKNIKGKRVTTKADNGKILLDDVEGKISGKANNGSISLVTNHLDRPIEFETDNGYINIQTEQEPKNATLDVQIDNGKANIFGSSDRNIKFGNGEHLIKLKTNNGRITVAK